MTFLPQIEHPWRIESKYKTSVPRVWVEMFNNQELRRRENVMKPLPIFWANSLTARSEHH
jgi:hypothetical protein